MDYKYNEKDVAMMKVALKDYQEDSRKGQLLGTTSMVLVGLLVNKRMHKSVQLSALSGLFAGALFYNIYTLSTRNYYNSLATIVNTNASLELNKVMHY
jgi:uncharacterized membrane protein YesL